jgi:hypothetical protein
MKLVASRDFANVPGLAIGELQTPDGKVLTAPHPKHVPKGSRFEIGKTDQQTIDDLNANDKLKIVQLLPSGGANCAVFAKDTGAVAKIDKEVAENQKRAKIENKPAVSLDDVVASNNRVADALGDLVSQLAAKKA